MQHPVPAERRRRRVTPPVRRIQPRRLGPAQPPAVNDLEQGRIPVSGQRPLAPRADRPVNLIIGVIQEQLQLLPGKRPRLRPALIPVQVRDRVPLMADRHRMGARPELALARRGPAIPAIAQVLAEQPQVRLVTPDRRQGQPPLGHQRLRPLLHVRRAPVPRVLVGERQEPADQPLPRRDRVLPQPRDPRLAEGPGRGPSHFAERGEGVVELGRPDRHALVPQRVAEADQVAGERHEVG